jgi:hypothetical protein
VSGARQIPVLGYDRNAAILPQSSGEKPMSFGDLCLFLGVLFAFATLILKVVEVAGRKRG